MDGQMDGNRHIQVQCSKLGSAARAHCRGSRNIGGVTNFLPPSRTPLYKDERPSYKAISDPEEKMGE